MKYIYAKNIFNYYITLVQNIFNMPPQLNTRLSRINQVAFTYSSTAQTFIWCESFKREKLARPTLRRSKSIVRGLDTQ
jgi:hypothetical protein